MSVNEFRAEEPLSAVAEAREDDLRAIEAFLQVEEDTAPAGTRYYDVDGILVRWRPGRQPEVLRAGTWRPYAELTKFAYGADEVAFPEFGRLVRAVARRWARREGAAD